MWRNQQVRNTGLEQHASFGGRLLRQHVDGRAAQIATLECGDQRFEIDERASRGVDHQRIVLHERELALADEPRGRRRQRAMQRQHIGDAQQLIERHTHG
jgi:hypothetical protein